MSQAAAMEHEVPVSTWSNGDPRVVCAGRTFVIVVEAHDRVWIANVSAKHGWSVLFLGVSEVRKGSPDAPLPPDIFEGDDWPGYRWTMAPS